MKKLGLTTLFALFALAVLAQVKQNIYFVKNDEKTVSTVDSADFIRIVQQPDSGEVLFNVLEYDKKQHIKLIGKSITYTKPVLEGQCATYYLNGKKKSITQYKNGSIIGQQLFFHANGKVSEVRDYLAKEKSTDTTSRYVITEAYDTTGRPIVTKGTGYYKKYSEDLKTLIMEGPLKNGMKDSVWKIQTSTSFEMDYKNTKWLPGTDSVWLTEVYANGKLVSGVSKFKDGQTFRYTEQSSIPAYPGGSKAFEKHMLKNLQYPVNARDKYIQGRVTVQFMIDEQGNLLEPKIASRHLNDDLEREALRIVSTFPGKWQPATLYGHPVKLQYAVLITFTLSEGRF